MRTTSRVALTFLAMSMSTSLAMAQGRPQGFEPSRGDGPDRGGANRCVCHEQMGMHGHRGGEEGRWGREEGRHGWQGRERGSFGLERIVDNPTIRERLGITAEQAAKIRQQTSEFRKTEIRNRAEASVKRIELHDLLSADKPDRAAIDKKLQEMSAARLAIEKARIDNQLAMRNALTPEQREKLKKMREEFWQHGPGHERMRGPRGMEHHQEGQGAKPPANPKGEN